jgi:hypothetical protein
VAERGEKKRREKTRALDGKSRIRSLDLGQTGKQYSLIILLIKYPVVEQINASSDELEESHPLVDNKSAKRVLLKVTMSPRKSK